MSDTAVVSQAAGLLAAAHTLLDDLLTMDVTRDADDEVVASLQEMERLRWRLDSADYRLIHEAERRGLPHLHGCKSTGRFLERMLRVDGTTAHQRVQAAAAAGPRTGLTGDTLGPVFPHVAAGQAQGVVSERQARLIEKTVDELPDQVAAVHGAQVEKDLVDYAASFGPKQLGVIAQRIVAHLNPDGTLTDPDTVQRRRGLWLIRHRDGSSRIEGHLSEECTERLLTFFDTAAAPHPAVDGVKDPRRPEQRAHDALLDLLEAAVRGGMVPSNNGVSATIVVTMTAEQYASGDGLARTGHGASVPVRTIKGWSGGDAEVLAVVLNSVKAISHYSNVHRIFTEQQRRAIAARDRGCTFPGCPEPPGRCQVDHIPRWEDTHVTCVDGGALKCRYHHREQERLGYRPVMLGGVPYWIPPVWIDPAQTPVRNTLFDDIPAA